jgi:hypothetical protein
MLPWMRREISTFVWQRLYGHHDSRVQLRQRSADGNLGPARTLSAPGYAGGSVTSVDVAPNGDAVVVWGLHRVQARAVAADGTLGPIQAISPRTDGYFFPQPQVVVDRFGNATFMWTGPDDEIRSRMRFADGTLGPVHRVTAGESVYGSVGVDAAGDAIFAWVGEHHSQGIRARVRALDGTWARSAASRMVGRLAPSGSQSIPGAMPSLRGRAASMIKAS